MSGAGSGLAGTVDGSFFQAPVWVDTSKPAGCTKQKMTAWGAWARNFATLRSLVYSPNLVWLCISALVYVVFPYDLDAARSGPASRWLGRRLIVNLCVTFAYYGFWELSLFHLGWASRKFQPARWPSAIRLAHNVAHCTGGVLIYTGFEAAFLQLWASGMLPYIKDAEILTSPADLLRFVCWTAIVPVWRSTHFYFAHRMLHFRVMYKYVHCLHHFNVDTEPFTGLAMHSVEHLYYFSCVGPSLYFRMSPFHFLWNGIHLLLSPAASHSGWEDHMQSDQFHHVHHARFEANYGSASVPLDKIFGTFRDHLYNSTEEADRAAVARPEGERLDLGPLKYSWFHAVYTLLSLLCFAVVAVAASGAGSLGSWPYTLAFLLSHGPIVLAVAMFLGSGEKKSMWWPFEKERWFGSFGLHLVLEWLVAVMPVGHAAVWLLLSLEAVR